MRFRWLPVFLALSAATAWGQAFDNNRRILLWEGTLRGSPRLMGIAGAYVGIAEGAEGITRTPAAVVSKDPHFEHDLRVDFGGTMHFLFPGGTKEQDWDNDGRPDQVPGNFRSLGTQVLYSTATVQYKDFGIGIGFDLQHFMGERHGDTDVNEKYYSITLIHLFPTVGWSFWRDQILVGVGLETTHAIFGYGEQPPGAFLPTPKDTAGFHAWGTFENGALRIVLHGIAW